MEGRGFWHDICNVSGMRGEDAKTRGHDEIGMNVAMGNGETQKKTDMEYKDLKELAWDVYGREDYEAEMRLRYMMECCDHCVWGGLSEEEIDEPNQKPKSGEL
jgi:hypothetical protein